MTVADESVKSLPDGFRYTERGAIEYRVARKDDEDEPLGMALLTARNPGGNPRCR